MRNKTTVLNKGDRFKIHTGFHAGRVYKITNFASSKFGIKTAVCEFSDQPGDAYLFTASDLDAFGSYLEVIRTTETEEQMMQRVNTALASKRTRRRGKRSYSAAA